jgi:hypothetical protein
MKNADRKLSIGMTAALVLLIAGAVPPRDADADDQHQIINPDTGQPLNIYPVVGNIHEPCQWPVQYDWPWPGFVCDNTGKCVNIETGEVSYFQWVPRGPRGPYDMDCSGADF